MLLYSYSIVLLSATISMPYLSNLMATSVVCFSGRCAAVLTISVRTFHTARYKATSFLFLLSSPSIPFTVEVRTDQRRSCFSGQHLSQHEFVSDEPFHEDCLQKKFKVLLAIAGLLAHI